MNVVDMIRSLVERVAVDLQLLIWQATFEQHSTLTPSYIVARARPARLLCKPFTTLGLGRSWHQADSNTKLTIPLAWVEWPASCGGVGGHQCWFLAITYLRLPRISVTGCLSTYSNILITLLHPWPSMNANTLPPQDLVAHKSPGLLFVTMTWQVSHQIPWLPRRLLTTPAIPPLQNADHVMYFARSIMCLWTCKFSLDVGSRVPLTIRWQ